MVGDRETRARRLFLDEARRRVLSLLCDLHHFGEAFGHLPSPWMFARLAIVGGVVMDDAAPDAAIEDQITAAEGAIRNGLIDLVDALADVPIPYVLTDEPEGRQALTVLRGGLVG